jgi:hypothetical protein
MLEANAFICEFPSQVLRSGSDYRRGGTAFTGSPRPGVEESRRRFSKSREIEHGRDLKSEAANLGRCDVLRTAGAITVADVTATGVSPVTPAAAQSIGRASSATRNGGPLGTRLPGVQHFGLTVQNMNRAFEFYTQSTNQDQNSPSWMSMLTPLMISTAP